MIGVSVKHLCENPKNYHVHCVGAITQVYISTRHKFSLRRNMDKSMYTRVFCTRVKSYGLCPHQQLQSIVECSTFYRRMLVTDICSIVYKFLAFTKSRLRSWSNICVFSFGVSSCLVTPFGYLFVSLSYWSSWSYGFLLRQACKLPIKDCENRNLRIVSQYQWV